MILRSVVGIARVGGVARVGLAGLIGIVGACVLAGAGVGEAHAQGRDAEELTTLEKNLASEHAALSTEDCATACRALASIRRAADRICALDPDERCVAARAKADDAARRVHEACPSCAVATVPVQPAPPMAKPASKGGRPASEPDRDEERVSTASANAPPAESRRGGCAGCATSGAPAGDVGALALALGALAVVMRRRGTRRV